MTKDVRQLIVQLEKAGCTVTLSRNSHVKVFHRGRLVTVMSSSPSDARTLRNTRAALRREGVTLWN